MHTDSCAQFVYPISEQQEIAQGGGWIGGYEWEARVEGVTKT
jgi:hypothetical protein